MNVARTRRATAADDAALRALLRASASDGNLRLSLRKDPNYFDATEVEGRRAATIMAIDRDTGSCVGVGTRSEKPCYLDGATDPVPLGYLGSLRILPEYRSGMGLMRGYRDMRHAHEEGSAQLYLSTVMQGNVVAQRLLTSGRAGLPTYHDHGRVITRIVRANADLWAPDSKHATAGIRVYKASDSGCCVDLDAVLRFLRSEGARWQFFPAYSREDLLSPTGLLRGLGLDDIYVAIDDRGICGTLAVWDQRPFRQWFVSGYSGALRWLRRPLNVLSHLLARPALPRPQQIMPYLVLALRCVPADRPDVLRTLLARATADLHHLGDDVLLAAGHHEADPLGAVFAAAPHAAMISRLYVVHWPDGAERYATLRRDLPPYLELGSL